LTLIFVDGEGDFGCMPFLADVAKKFSPRHDQRSQQGVSKQRAMGVVDIPHGFCYCVRVNNAMIRKGMMSRDENLGLQS